MVVVTTTQNANDGRKLQEGNVHCTFSEVSLFWKVLGRVAATSFLRSFDFKTMPSKKSARPASEKKKGDKPKKATEAVQTALALHALSSLDDQLKKVDVVGNKILPALATIDEEDRRTTEVTDKLHEKIKRIHDKYKKIKLEGRATPDLVNIFLQEQQEAYEEASASEGISNGARILFMNGAVSMAASGLVRLLDQ
jgi:vacuolar-type H+-ATPase subunit I/STV1